MYDTQALWSWDLTSPPVKWSFPEVVGCVALQEGPELLLGLQSGLFSFNPVTGAARRYKACHGLLQLVP